ncbi:hypothetical protein PROFUN_09725 [Planoprotostelium fungivorum]|uniref:Uncharacterized protein n=1 Tax=Planoprotostelium fungivorum TaxID=1890364 RepID=A0A2P6NEV6_9EUKA|nr:hypothetical protein PROFUN_09725 [Planoprotostelium fungivorum]
MVELCIQWLIVSQFPQSIVDCLQNTKIRGKKCKKLNKESDDLKGLFEKELASYNNRKQCRNEKGTNITQLKTMSLELQLEEMQKELENKIDFIRKQMIVIRAFNERFDQLDQTIMIQQTTEQRPESFASFKYRAYKHLQMFCRRLPNRTQEAGIQSKIVEFLIKIMSATYCSSCCAVEIDTLENVFGDIFENTSFGSPSWPPTRKIKTETYRWIEENNIISKSQFVFMKGRIQQKHVDIWAMRQTLEAHHGLHKDATPQQKISKENKGFNVNIINLIILATVRIIQSYTSDLYYNIIAFVVTIVRHKTKSMRAHNTPNNCSDSNSQSFPKFPTFEKHTLFTETFHQFFP